MGYGYRIIEPEVLDYLVKTEQHEIAVAILSWIAKRVSERLQSVFPDDVVFEVIKVTYMGSYPSLGLGFYIDEHVTGFYKHGEETRSNLEQRVRDEVELFLQDGKFLDFAQFAAGKDWKAITAKLMR